MRLNQRSVRQTLAAVMAVGFFLATAAPWAYAVRQNSTNETPGSESPTEASPEKGDRPPIYDVSANAEEQIQAALAHAKKENRRVLIQWGGNWCGWCHHLHQLMTTDQEIARKLMYEYDVVLVDIGEMDKNQELVKKFGVDLETNGVPFLTVLDADGDVVVNQETSSLEKEDKEDPGHNPQAVLEFLSKFSAEPLDARVLLDSATKQADSQNKYVFLRFGAPWCGWCHRMDAWMEKPEIDSVLDAAFVHLKVDTDRMSHGQEMLDEYCSEPGGIPWFVLIDPETQSVLATSNGPQGNVGFPFEDFEIDHFCEMLEKCNGKLSVEQIAALKQSLTDNREATKARTAEAASRAATGTAPTDSTKQ